MALDRESVELGILILQQINKSATVVTVKEFNSSKAYINKNKIYCIDEKSDSGYETVFINIENITPDQIMLWNKLNLSLC